MTFFRKSSRLRPIALLLLVAVVLPLLVGGGVAAPRVVSAADAAQDSGTPEEPTPGGSALYQGLKTAAIAGTAVGTCAALTYFSVGTLSWLCAPILSTAGLVGAGAVVAGGAALGYFGSTIENAMGTAAKAVIAFIVNTIELLLNGLAFSAAYFVFLVADYNGFGENETVTMGWIAVRDVANLFFIFVLFLIAFSTMVGSEKLHYKQHLVKLLLMAILINFSKTITLILIDFSQVVMKTFISPLAAAGPLTLLTSLGFLKGGAWAGVTDHQAGVLDFIVGKVADVLFIAISTVVLVIMGAMLLMRIVMLWILLILSPLAFFLSTFPQGQQYSGKWWQELGKNLVAGPVLAFFLWLALVTKVGLIPQGAVEEVNKQIQSYGAAISGTARSQFGNIANFAITIGFLLAGLKMASETGAAGAGMAGSAFSGIQKLGKGALGVGWSFGKVPFEGALKKWRGNKFVQRHPYLEPVSWYKGREEYRQKMMKRSGDAAQSRAYAAYERKKTGYESPVEDFIEMAAEKEDSAKIQPLSEEEQSAMAQSLKGLKEGKDGKVHLSRKKLNDEQRRLQRSLILSQGKEGYIDGDMLLMAQDDENDDEEVREFKRKFRATMLAQGYNRRAAGLYMQSSVGSTKHIADHVDDLYDIQEGLKQEDGWTDDKGNLIKEKEEDFYAEVDKRFGEGFEETTDDQGQRIIYEIQEAAKQNGHPELMGGTIKEAKPGGKRKALFGKDAEAEMLRHLNKQPNGRTNAGLAHHAYSSPDSNGYLREDMTEEQMMTILSAWGGNEASFIRQWMQTRVAAVMLGGKATGSKYDKSTGVFDATKGGASKGLLAFCAANVPEAVLAASQKQGGPKDAKVENVKIQVLVDKEGKQVTDYEVFDKMMTEEERKEFGVTESRDMAGLDDKKRNEIFERHGVDKKVLGIKDIAKSSPARRKSGDEEEEGTVTPTPATPAQPATATASAPTATQNNLPFQAAPVPPQPGELPFTPTAQPAPAQATPAPAPAAQPAPAVAPQPTEASQPTSAPAQPAGAQAPQEPFVFPTAEFDKLTRAVEGLATGMKGVEGLATEMKGLGTKIEKIDVASGLQTVFQRFGQDMVGLNAVNREQMARLARAMKNRLTKEKVRKQTPKVEKRGEDAL